jgi:predicted transcriptional regulator
VEVVEVVKVGVEKVVLDLSEREAQALLNLLDGEAYWGELSEVLERVLKGLKRALKERELKELQEV